MGDSLSELLPQLAEQDYDKIVVLDDASTDDSHEVVESMDDPRVTFISGSENVGAGANRNRIIEALGALSIIHFVDADMVIETSNVPEVANDIASDRSLGFVGGLVKDANNRQDPYNYGPRASLWTAAGAKLQDIICRQIDTDPERAAFLRRRLFAFVQDFPDPQNDPVARQIFWSAEGNFLIRSDTFQEVGGFDTQFRFHEIQDLARKLSERGMERRFDPELSGIHKAIQVRQESRRTQRWKAEVQLARKYGLRDWFFPDFGVRPTL